MKMEKWKNNEVTGVGERR